MKTYEYKIIKHEYTSKNTSGLPSPEELLSNELNSFGKDGWRLFVISNIIQGNIYVVLEREKEDASE